MVGGWEMCVRKSSLCWVVVICRASHWKKYLVAKEWELSRRCEFKGCVGVDVVRLLIRMVIDQSHDSNSAGGSSGTKGGGVHIIAQSGMNWFEYYFHPLPPPRSIFNFVAWLYSCISNQMIGVHTNSTSHAELHKLLLSKLYSYYILLSHLSFSIYC